MDKTNVLVKRENEIGRLITDIIIISIGLMISSFGISLFYEAGMGSGAMATFSDGLHQLLNISYGTANMAANVVFLVLLVLCDRRMVNVGTVCCVFLIGPFVDLGSVLFGMLPIAGSHFFVRFLCMLTGCVMMGVGLALYVAVDRGFGALEGLVKFFCAKTKLSFDKVKIAEDLLLIGLGMLLHAEWGIGTVISAVVIGPIMSVFIARFQKVLGKTR